MNRCASEMYAALIFALFIPFQAGAAHAAYREVVEEDYTYRAVKGDYIERIAGMNGVELSRFYELNPEAKNARLIHPGDEFRIVRRTVVPAVTDDGIVVNVPDRTLYIFRGGRLAAHYPAGLGRADWPTPTGGFTVLGKQRNPAWHVPPSIRREMAKKGKPVRKVVPPGRDNPLGRWAVKLSMPGVLIHETIWPESVYRFRSHGCVRLKPGDAENIYTGVEKGDAGMIIYEPVKLALTDEGRIFLEVHGDVYGLAYDLEGLAYGEIIRSGLEGRVDWEKVKETVAGKDGVATDVSK